jgi:hypothetical protein
MLMVVVNIFNCGYVGEVHAVGQDGSPARPHAQDLDSLHPADAFGAAVPLPLLSQMATSLMGLASISNFHIYNLLQVLEKGECLAESESELISSQSTLLAQGISLTNLISTVAKQRAE